MNNRQFLKEELIKFNIDADEKLVDDFQKYNEMLIDWNSRVNLTGITEEREVYVKHFLDSVSLFKYGYIKDNMSIIDVGTGAGFPGIPFKMCNKTIELTLLDSLNKRINFLKEVCSELKLKGVDFVHSRAEDGGKNKDYREKFDIATARAVANLPVLLELCVPFVKKGGYFICLKGPNADSELEISKKAMSELGVKFVEKIDVLLPDQELKHKILVFEKTINTPKKYPRKAGTPGRNPLK